MRLFIKILLFLFVSLVTNVKATAYSSLHTEIAKTVGKVIENDLANVVKMDRI